MRAAGRTGSETLVDRPQVWRAVASTAARTLARPAPNPATSSSVPAPGGVQRLPARRRGGPGDPAVGPRTARQRVVAREHHGQGHRRPGVRGGCGMLPGRCDHRVHRCVRRVQLGSCMATPTVPLAVGLNIARAPSAVPPVNMAPRSIRGGPARRPGRRTPRARTSPRRKPPVTTSNALGDRLDAPV